MTALFIGAFWALQIAANLLFKYGSLSNSRWWSCFILGNLIGMSSIFFMMKIYVRMNANIALTIAGGGTFLLVQFAMAMTFNSKLTMIQWSGIMLVAVGMIIAGLGNMKIVQ